MRVFAICAVLLVLTGSAYGKDLWQKGTVYFNDQSSVVGEINMGSDHISVMYENERVKVPYQEVKSLEILSVKKGESKKKGKYAPDSMAKLSLKNGTVAEVQADTDHHFCIDREFGFSIRKNNPLTRIMEEKGFNWVGHRSSAGSSCVFSDKPYKEKMVLKVVFD